MSAGHNGSTQADPGHVGIRGDIKDRYQDYSHARMLSALVELEMVCTLHSQDFIAPIWKYGQIQDFSGGGFPALPPQLTWFLW